MIAGFDVLRTEIVNFLDFFVQFLADAETIVKKDLFLKRKIEVTERARSLSKAIAMVICPIIAHYSTLRGRSIHDVACEFACAVRMRRNNLCERP